MLGRAAKGGVAVAVVALVLLVPSLSANVAFPFERTSASNLGPDAADCVINVTLSTVFAFALSNDYCATPVSQITINVLMTVSANPHTFTLSSVANYTFPSTDQTSDLQTFFASNPPLVNIVPNPVTGASNTTTISAPGVGLYEAVCMESGHFAAGMHVQIGVGVMPPSSGSGTPGIGAPALIIAGTIASLVVIALVLGFVVGRRRGPEEEMPPERLGYAEPPTTTESAESKTNG